MRSEKGWGCRKLPPPLSWDPLLILIPLPFGHAPWTAVPSLSPATWRGRPKDSSEGGNRGPYGARGAGPPPQTPRRRGQTPGWKEREGQERAKLSRLFLDGLSGRRRESGDSGGNGGLGEGAMSRPARPPGYLCHLPPDSVTREIASLSRALPLLPLLSRPAITALSSPSPRSQSFLSRICTCGGILQFLNT